MFINTKILPVYSYDESQNTKVIQGAMVCMGFWIARNWPIEVRGTCGWQHFIHGSRAFYFQWHTLSSLANFTKQSLWPLGCQYRTVSVRG